MNHVAFNVPEERFLEYRAKLKAKGVQVSPVLDHDDSEFGVARELHPGVFVRSFYFQDPDGILLEFACWRRAMGQPGDVRHEALSAMPGAFSATSGSGRAARRTCRSMTSGRWTPYAPSG